MEQIISKVAFELLVAVITFCTLYGTLYTIGRIVRKIKPPAKTVVDENYEWGKWIDDETIEKFIEEKRKEEGN